MLGGGGPAMHMMWSQMFNPQKPELKRKVEWRRMGAFFRPYWKQESLILVCIAIGSLIGLLPPLFAKWIIDDAIPQRAMGQVVFNVAGMIASAVSSGVLGVYQGYLNSLVGEGIMRDIRTTLVAHLHRMPLSFFTGTKTGEIMNRVSSDVDNIDNVVTGTLVSIVTNVATMVTTVVDDLRARLAVGAGFAGHHPADDRPALAGRPPDVRHPQADARETRRDRVDHAGDALDLRDHVDQVVRPRAVRARALL